MKPNVRSFIRAGSVPSIEMLWVMYPYRGTRRKNVLTNRSARSLAATRSSACLAIQIAADIVFLDSREAVAALAFSTTGKCIAASAG